jgi:hypothetical protein
MKQFDVKAERTLNGNRFYIRPLPAFVSANLSGEISSLIMPIIASVAPAASKAVEKDNAGIFDTDISAQDLANGFSSISGDRVEGLLKKLLVKHKNVSVEREGESEAQHLTEDLANELFCGDAQDMFILAFDVIKVNFSGFFGKIIGLSGGPLGALLGKTQTSPQSTGS